MNVINFRIWHTLVSKQQMYEILTFMTKINLNLWFYCMIDDWTEFQLEYLFLSTNVIVRIFIFIYKQNKIWYSWMRKSVSLDFLQLWCSSISILVTIYQQWFWFKYVGGYFGYFGYFEGVELKYDISFAWLALVWVFRVWLSGPKYKRHYSGQQNLKTRISGLL